MPSALRRLLDSPWPYFAGAFVLLLAAIASQFEVQLPARPLGEPADIAKLQERDDLNVVFILVDTLRADRLGSYGYERDTSRNLDVLARYGIRFADVTAQSSWTKSSMASIWTGTLPANNGVVRYNHVLPHEARMPAEIFSEAGYRTAGIWRNGWVAPNFGFDQGFDLYLTPRPGQERKRAQGRHPAGAYTLRGTDEDVLRSAFEFLDAFGRDRFFLYLHFMDVHQYVYDEMAARFGTSYSDVYDQSIDWVDRLIALFVNRLDELGVSDRTVIAITSDHGEAFLEHGSEGHARNLYAEVVKVPFIISLPFRLDPGIVVTEPVSNVDVFPTLLDLVGLPGLMNPDGRSRVPSILAAAEADAGAAEVEPLVIAHLDRRWGRKEESDPIVAVSDGRKRVIWPVEASQRYQLYDVVNDPMEQHNLFDPDERDPEAEHLVEIAREYHESGAAPWGVGAKEVEIDELRLNQLRALGYVVR